MSKKPVLTCSGCGRTWYGDSKYAGTPHTECKSKGQWSFLSFQFNNVSTERVQEVLNAEVASEGAFEPGDVVTPNEVTGMLQIGQWYTVESRYPSPTGEGDWYDLTYTVEGDALIMRGIPGSYLTGGSR